MPKSSLPIELRFAVGTSEEIREAVQVAYLQGQEPLRATDLLVKRILLAILWRMEQVEDRITESGGVW